MMALSFGLQQPNMAAESGGQRGAWRLSHVHAERNSAARQQGSQAIELILGQRVHRVQKSLRFARTGSGADQDRRPRERNRGSENGYADNWYFKKLRTIFSV